MRAELRRVVALPMEEIWDDRGMIATRRLRRLTAEDIRDLLRLGPLRFAVGDVGRPLRWIAEADRFQFWKAEGQPHLAMPDVPIDRDAFPGGLAYLASEWESPSGPPIVLLELLH